MPATWDLRCLGGWASCCVCILQALNLLLYVLQLKRTNVGIALVTSPRVLFLDEPTSGVADLHPYELRRHSSTLTLSALVLMLCPLTSSTYCMVAKAQGMMMHGNCCATMLHTCALHLSVAPHMDCCVCRPGLIHGL